MPDIQALLEKIQALPIERIAEIEDFVEFIVVREQERSLTRAFSAASEASFASVWNNPDDDVYDAL
jgi:hypothetical protein